MVVNRKALIWFLVLAFAPAWVLFTLPMAFGEPGTPSRQVATLISWAIAMWSPGLAALIVTRWVEGKPIRSLNLRRLGPKRAYLWAWLIPPFLTILTGLLTWILGLGVVDTNFTLIRESMQGVPGGEAVPPALIVAIQAFFAFTLGSLFNTLFGLGEELGWRGYLLPGLLGLGQWRAILISGAIWGVWHAPAILQGHNYPEHPVLGVFMMVAFCVLMGTIFSWLYLWTRSPWAPALGHGSLNAIAGLPLLFLTGVDLAFGGTLTSLVGWIPLAAFIAWLVWSRRLPVEAENVSRETMETGDEGSAARAD
jgi:membrane protease YdiL (CAAX protease family)